MTPPRSHVSTVPSCVASSCAVMPSSETLGRLASGPAARCLAVVRALDEHDRAEPLSVDDERCAGVGRPDEPDVLPRQPDERVGSGDREAGGRLHRGEPGDRRSAARIAAVALRLRGEVDDLGARRAARPARRESGDAAERDVRRLERECRRRRVAARRSRPAAARRSQRPTRAAPSRAGRRRALGETLTVYASWPATFDGSAPETVQFLPSSVRNFVISSTVGTAWSAVDVDAPDVSCGRSNVYAVFDDAS